MSIDDELRWDGELTVTRHDRATGTTFVIPNRLHPSGTGVGWHAGRSLSLDRPRSGGTPGSLPVQ